MTNVPGWEESSPIIGVVYAARRFESPEFRYVGITTKTTEVRRRQHLKAARAGTKNPFYDWLRTMQTDEDVYFQPMELVTGGELEDLGAAEQRWIAELRGNGHRLLNLSEGGLGPRYAALIRERARTIFGVPGRLTDAEADRYLDRLQGQATFTALVAEASQAQHPDDMLASAQALHQWQQEKTR